ncbi:protein phosphatase 2C domain-containing protein [Streptomyces sp. NPDC059166]|uniref:protein phosphatase 2C domain-containing protein n=1 Tax=Streptomyces sp. NPDC059166 TaxID=3346752 RepID=UPI00369EA3F9
MRDQGGVNDPLDETWRTAERVVAATPVSPLTHPEWPEADRELPLPDPEVRSRPAPDRRPDLERGAYGPPSQACAWEDGQTYPEPDRQEPHPVGGFRADQPAAPAEQPSSEAPPPTLGEPAHSGTKPPMYPPVPLELPYVGADPAAAVLPDIVVDGAQHGSSCVRAASVRGDSHRYLGEPRQDALCVTRIGRPGAGELLVLAVADGVGSAAHSHVGSNEACRLTAAYLDRAAEDLCAVLAAGDGAALAQLVDGVVGEIAVLLTDLALRNGHPPAAYATTLRVLLVPLDPAVRLRGFFAVGDGGTALLRAGRWTLDITEAGGEGSGVIDTRTDALPLARSATTSVIGPVAPGDVLLLCTDGLSTPLAGEPEMRAFLASAWGGGTVPGPADFLWQTQFRVKSYDDDRTAVVLWEGRNE